jgi:predicted metal-binding protein
LEDEFDGEGMMETERRHAQSFHRFAKELRKKHPGMLPMGTGSCRNCDLCSYPDSPCLDPLGATSPMEAFGIMVSEVCKANGIAYYHGKGTITFTGCYLLE